MREHRYRRRISGLQILLGGMLWLASTWAAAGVPSLPFISPTPFASNTLISSGVGVSGPIHPVTVLCNNAGGSTVCAISAFALAGANAADFSIVAGGTCVPGATVLTSGGTCTVNLQYRPSSAGQETALLQATCFAFASNGGFNVVCDGASHSFDNLFGVLVLPVATPALGPTGITLLALLMIATGVYFALRRSKR